LQDNVLSHPASPICIQHPENRSQAFSLRSQIVWQVEPVRGIEIFMKVFFHISIRNYAK
jgi:hypothetical protein